LNRNESVSVKWVSRSAGDVGCGVRGGVVSVSGRSAIPKRISRGVALSAGMIRSFSERMASSRCWGQLWGMDLGSTIPGSSSKSGEHNLFNLLRSKLLVLSTRPLIQGVLVAERVNCGVLEVASTVRHESPRCCIVEADSL